MRRGEIERTADPSQRLPEAAPVDEVGELTGVLNRMLASLEEARAGERRFLADASHELRTPVTALLGNVEYAIRHGADAEVLADLRHDAGRLARLVDSLLALERAGADRRRRVTEPVALAELAARRSMTPRTPGRVVLGAVAPVHRRRRPGGAVARARQPRRERARPRAGGRDGDRAVSRRRRARAACRSATRARARTRRARAAV